MLNPRPEVLSPRGNVGSSSNLQFKAERIKIPSTPRYPRSVVGSDRGENSHSCPCLPARTISFGLLCVLGFPCQPCSCSRGPLGPRASLPVPEPVDDSGGLYCCSLVGKCNPEVESSSHLTKRLRRHLFQPRRVGASGPLCHLGAGHEIRVILFWNSPGPHSLRRTWY